MSKKYYVKFTIDVLNSKIEVARELKTISIILMCKNKNKTFFCKIIKCDSQRRISVNFYKFPHLHNRVSKIQMKNNRCMKHRSLSQKSTL